VGSCDFRFVGTANFSGGRSIKQMYQQGIVVTMITLIVINIIIVSSNSCSSALSK
jgi:hypothetical protein